MRRAISIFMNCVYGADRPTHGRAWAVGASRLSQSEPMITREQYGAYMAARRSQIVAAYRQSLVEADSASRSAWAVATTRE